MQREPQALSLAPDQARQYIDQNFETAYQSMLNFTQTASAPDLRRAQPLVGYIVAHDLVGELPQVYLAAHWENAVRRLHRLGQIGLVDTCLPDIQTIDATDLTE